MVYETLVVEQHGPVHWVTMNRPERLNALNAQMVDELLDYFQQRYFDREIRVIVLRGAGTAYCAGLDLKERPNSNAPPDVSASLLHQRLISEIVMRMRRCPQPILSLVHGAACGCGF